MYNFKSRRLNDICTTSNLVHPSYKWGTNYTISTCNLSKNLKTTILDSLAICCVWEVLWRAKNIMYNICVTKTLYSFKHLLKGGVNFLLTKEGVHVNNNFISFFSRTASGAVSGYLREGVFFPEAKTFFGGLVGY